jgi:hypothetical protein
MFEASSKDRCFKKVQTAIARLVAASFQSECPQLTDIEHGVISSSLCRVSAVLSRVDRVVAHTSGQSSTLCSFPGCQRLFSLFPVIGAFVVVCFVRQTERRA